MPKRRIDIKNSKGEKIAVVLDENKNATGLAFVMHGLGGFKEQPHILTLINTIKKKNYTVVSFDTTNTFGASDGDYINATVTNYYEDLEDVINWTKKQSWYKEPFLLTGHSVGGFSIALFAEKYPNMVKSLTLFSAVVSGELWKKVQDKSILENWKKDGVWIREGSDINGKKKKVLAWSFAEDIMQYDLLKQSDKLKMPVLLVVGEKDPTTPVNHQKVLFDHLTGRKELHVIFEAEHTFKGKRHLDAISNILSNWLNSVV